MTKPHQKLLAITLALALLAGLSSCSNNVAQSSDTIATSSIILTG